MGAGEQRVEFRVLGPLEVEAGGRLLELPGPRVRVLLALLLADAGRVVSVPALVAGLWGQDAPPDASRTTRTYVSLLRKALQPVAAELPAGELVVTRPPGYLLRPGPDAVDAARFERLAAEGRRALAAGHPAVAAERLSAALELWRGEAYGEFAGTAALRAEAARLDQLRLGAVADRIEADLAAGLGRELVAELERLTASHPRLERLWAQLMTALYRAGRQTEALATYRRARAALVAGSGREPSAQLAGVHQQVLAHDPRLLAARTAWATGRSAARPAQLPAAVPAFTGREAELAELDAVLSGAEPASAVVIAAVAGTAGVGKTALAVHWAHRVAPYFPDGQLYVNLRGYDPQAPATAEEALAGFLAALGVAGEDIPLGLDERAARYRAAIAGRRMLVVADNAGSVEQVSPLLPGTPTATVLVTSRDTLTGLLAQPGAYRLDLDLLPVADAVALLRELVGARVDADPAAAALLAEQCARLPLAVRIAAELAASRPDTPLADLAAELADRQRRLDLLDAGGDPRAAVPAVFSWSIRHLPADAARAFGLLGLHPGPDTDGYAAAALLGTGVEAAGRLLDRLARAHLLQPTGTGRYGMHDLLRAYAAGLAETEHPPADRRAALGRLLDHQLAAAGRAMHRLHPAETGGPDRAPPATTPLPPLDDPDTARAWLEVERPALTALTGYAATGGWPDHAVRLAATLFRYLAGSHRGDALTVHQHARHAARQAGDRAGEAQALTALGIVHGQTGQHERAAGYFRQALEQFRQAGDPVGEARALGNLGTVEERLGRYRPAAEHLQRALELFRQAGNPAGQARALDSLSTVDTRLGRYAAATEHLRQALALYRQVGDRVGEAHALDGLGAVELRLGRHRSALDHHLHALELFRQAGSRIGEAWALSCIGDVHTCLRRPREAADHLRQALALFREIGDRDGEPWALNGLGEAARVAGHPASAVDYHAAALAAAASTGSRNQQARAHAGLADAYAALGQPVPAGRHRQQALDGYAELGIPG